MWNPTTRYVSGTAARSGTQSVSGSKGRHEIRGTRCFLPSPPATLLEAVLHIVERERERKILHVPKTNIGPREISPSRPHPHPSCLRRRHGERGDDAHI